MALILTRYSDRRRINKPVGILNGMDFDNLPIIPHEDIAEVDCCGCLMVRLREEKADIVCNE
jgi:hypothetical protein